MSATQKHTRIPVYKAGKLLRFNYYDPDGNELTKAEWDALGLAPCCEQKTMILEAC